MALTKNRRDERRWGLVFITPVMLEFVLVVVVPVGIAFYASLTNWNILRRTRSFIGFTNFAQALADDRFWIALSNTFFMLLPIPIYLFFGLLLALACHRRTPGSKVFRLLFFLPYISSIVALVAMWRWLFNYKYGLVNQTLMAVFGVQGPDWLGDPKWIKITIVIMIAWKLIGLTSIYLLAALNSIPDTYYEAARLDGASTLQQFRRITIPLITPTLFFLTVVGIIGSLQTFVEVQLFTTNGGRNYSAATVSYYIWQRAFGNNQIGYACAVVLLFGALILAITIFQMRMSKRWVYEGE